ncbi:HAD family hydrolase [Solicola sp. PLA-1-18]|uniref:HAD family hydrolase n=1 Tax=Solicola sp. PLA-1-18 TaxID=3380532 RepID=UPI003B7F0D96
MTTPDSTWWLLDYGNVVSTSQPDADRDELVRLSGARAEGFWERYWAYRHEYDLGVDDESYWSRVCDRPLVTGTDALDAIVAADNASWSHHRPEVLDLLAAQRASGRRLAMLSNAPHALARHHETDGAVDVFERRFYSAPLGLAKPDAAIYTHVLDELGAAPGDVTFVDDRADNVEAASALGFHAVLFQSSEDLLALAR